MSLDLEIQSLLRSNEVWKIDFSMAGMRITKDGYWVLAKRFSNREIAHRVRVYTRPELVGSRNEALYEPRQDKIRLRSPNVMQTLSGRATVIHECTHALLDFRDMRSNIRSDEGTAFVAAAMYMHICSASFNEIDEKVTEDIRNIAIELFNRSSATSSTAAMTADQINTVRRTMARFYGTGYYLSNGIHGLRYRGL